MLGYFSVPDATCMVLENALGGDLDFIKNQFYSNKKFIRNNLNNDYSQNTPINMEIWVNFMSENLVRYFIKQIADALKYLKNLNLVHLDLNLENVFLTSNFMIKLGDYGLSKMIRNGEVLKLDVWQSGSNIFTAPEVLQGKTTSCDDIYKIDIYSLGVCLFCLLTGQSPFQKNILDKLSSSSIKENLHQETIQKICEALGKDKIIAKINIFRGNSISSELVNLLVNSLSFDEKHRYDINKLMEDEWLNQNIELVESNINLKKILRKSMSIMEI